MVVKQKKFTVTMQPSVLERVEEYAERHGISRSSALSVLASQALEQREAMSIMSKLPEIMETVKDMKQVERSLLT